MKKLITLICILCFTPLIHSQNENKPNVVLIIIDDAGWKDVGYNGGNIKLQKLIS
ncbi:hypothetical protein [Algibacter lectus]|uniref:hypothetical protein n=1 Tax=Algibacter lectus TaxID=221126 RepID=UPI00187BE44F|nr:hypothetical protein [Algibacter lectus]